VNLYRKRRTEPTSADSEVSRRLSAGVCPLTCCGMKNTSTHNAVQIEKPMCPSAWGKRRSVIPLAVRSLSNPYGPLRTLRPAGRQSVIGRPAPARSGRVRGKSDRQMNECHGDPMCRRYRLEGEIVEWQRFRSVNDRYRVAEQGVVFHYHAHGGTGAVMESRARPAQHRALFTSIFGCLVGYRKRVSRQ
jgi:hypothetical protein